MASRSRFVQRGLVQSTRLGPLKYFAAKNSRGMKRVHFCTDRGGGPGGRYVRLNAVIIGCYVLTNGRVSRMASAFTGYIGL